MGSGSMLSGRPLRLALLSLLSMLALSLGAAAVARADSPFDMRGEWAFTMTCSCGQSTPGTMVIRQMDTTSGAFSGTTELDGLIPGTATGTSTSSTVSLELYFPHTPYGESRFMMENAALEPVKAEFSGSGTYNPSTNTGTLTAKRIRTLAQVEQAEKEAAERAKEAREKAEKEALEREAKEAEEKPIREKAEAEQHEREAKEKAQQEATEHQQAKEQQEARERQSAKEQQEAKERQQAKEQQEARERAERAAREAALVKPPTAPLEPAKPSVRTISVSNSGTVSLQLSDPDGYAISGEVVLTGGASKGGASSAKHTHSTLAHGTFTIAAHAKTLVKLKLSRSAAAMLANHRSLHVEIEITTNASGYTPVTKTYGVTLQSPSRTRH